MRVETKQVYYADDGTVFDDEAACKKYEDSIRERVSRTSYWVVHHSPDLTEGRGYCGIAYLEAYIPADYPAQDIWLEDWCIKTLGRKLAFVQGVSPMPAWILHKIDREKFLKKQDGSIGSTRISAKAVKLIVGDKESGLLETHAND
jgi:hypothetical protein